MNSSIKVDPRAVYTLSEGELRQLFFFWAVWARDSQVAPRGPWTTWMMMGGRGSGKTRAGAEWVRSLAGRGVSPIAIVSASMIEAIEVMVRGESGIMRVHPQEERPKLRGTTLAWPNGVEATILGAADPERFRGPSSRQHGATSWRSGTRPKRRGTCCSSGCGWATGRGSW